jgi:hypothetical protein
VAPRARVNYRRDCSDATDNVARSDLAADIGCSREMAARSGAGAECEEEERRSRDCEEQEQDDQLMNVIYNDESGHFFIYQIVLFAASVC